MLTFLLIVAVLGDILLALLLWAAHTDLASEEEQGWLVRRTFMKLRDGEPLVGDERYIARNYLGNKLVDAIQQGRVGVDGKVVARD